MSICAAHRLLLIEPDPRSREAMGAVLDQAGLGACCVRDLATAVVELVAMKSCACVVLGDVDRGAVDAADLFDRLWSYLVARRIPVVVARDCINSPPAAADAAWTEPQHLLDLLHVVRSCVDPSTVVPRRSVLVSEPAG